METDCAESVSSIHVHSRSFAVKTCFALLALAGCGGEARPGLRVAAAADLQFALEEAVREFRAGNPEIEVEATYGSSGNFYAQLRNRAPFDLFLSADREYPRLLAAEGLTMGGEFLYAIGRLAVWVPAHAKVEPELQAMARPEVRRIAIANPRHAPYGKAAVAALRHAGIYERIRDKLVFGENVAQALQFASGGAADAGIVALPLAIARGPGEGRYREVPPESYPRMEQAGAILQWTKNAREAETFRSFLLGPRGRAILERFGFTLPEAP
jgi:molybdate transport system substrate-binding protein